MLMVRYGSLCFRESYRPDLIFLKFWGLVCPRLLDATNFHVDASVNGMNVDACARRWFFKGLGW